AQAFECYGIGPPPNACWAYHLARDLVYELTGIVYDWNLTANPGSPTSAGLQVNLTQEKYDIDQNQAVLVCVTYEGETKVWVSSTGDCSGGALAVVWPQPLP